MKINTAILRFNTLRLQNSTSMQTKRTVEIFTP